MEVMDLLLTFQFNTRLESFVAKFKTAECSSGNDTTFGLLSYVYIITISTLNYIFKNG